MFGLCSKYLPRYLSITLGTRAERVQGNLILHLIILVIRLLRLLRTNLLNLKVLPRVTAINAQAG